MNYLKNLQKSPKSRISIDQIFSQLLMYFQSSPYSIDYDPNVLHDEKHILSHNKIGTLSLQASKDGKLNFIVTFKPFMGLNEDATAIGYATQASMKLLERIRYFGHKFTGNPSDKIEITHWGQLRTKVIQIPAKTGDDDDNDAKKCRKRKCRLTVF